NASPTARSSLAAAYTLSRRLGWTRRSVTSAASAGAGLEEWAAATPPASSARTVSAPAAGLGRFRVTASSSAASMALTASTAQLTALTELNLASDAVGRSTWL